MLIRIKEQEELVKTELYPFAKFPFEYFNKVQSGLFDVYDKDANFIVAANTSAGKTCVFEMIAAHEVRVRGNKVIYLSPLKALSQEKIDDWIKEHHFSDLKISILTGDYRMTHSRVKELNDADIIIMTSEILNSLSRNHKADKNQFLQRIGLIGIDEAHSIGSGSSGSTSRGSHLESGIMKFTAINKQSRLLLLSATLPNVDEVGNWLSSITERPTYLLESNWRPCKLNIHYEQYWDKPFAYDENERKKVYLTTQLIKKHIQDKFICFVHTKKTGEMLVNHLDNCGIECEYHNANLSKEKRTEVEQRFRNDPKLKVVVATSTVSQGINLPARRVVVVGVHRGLTEVETQEVVQGCGRSGRPQYDTEGDAYILLPRSKFDYHKERLEEKTYIRSQMLNPKVLAFHLVSEIHHGNIRSLEDVHIWYSRTLAHFQKQIMDDDAVDTIIQNLILSGCVKEEENGFYTTALGTVSSMFYYSPFDVVDLYRNFDILFRNDKASKDIWLAVALGNLDSQRVNIVNSAEREEMEEFFTEIQGSKIEKSFSPKMPLTAGAIKTAYCYLQLLTGASPSKNMNNISRLLQMDFGRTGEVLNALETMTGKWGREQFFKELGLRVAYGITPELVDLCKLSNIGKVKSKKLYDAGIRGLKDMNDVIKIIQAIGCSKVMAENLINEAKTLYIGNG